MVHWAPIPDPQADFRGMSPLTPVVRDVQGDDQMAAFKIRYLQHDATPNMVIKYAQRLQPGTVDAIRERVQARYGGPDNAGKALVLDQGADLTLAGNSLSQMDFGAVQAVGTERILAACSGAGGPGRPRAAAGRRAGLPGEHAEAGECLGAAAVAVGVRGPVQIVDVPAGNRLWFDTADIQALQDGEMERGQAALVRVQALLAPGAGGLHARVGYRGGGRDGPVASLKAGGVGTPSSSQPVQHLLPQAQPGATADPLPATMPRLGVGSDVAG